SDLDVEREVDERSRGDLAVDEDVLLGQVPPAGAHDDRRKLLIGLERVVFAVVVGEVNRSVYRVQEVELPADDGVPMRRVRVFLIGEPNLRTRVEGVDGHASIRGAGDLHPAIRQPGRGWGDSPRVVGADVFGLGEEVQGASGRELGLTSAPRGKRFLAATFEGPV